MKATEIKKLLAKDKLTVDEVGKLFLTAWLAQETGEKPEVEFSAYDLIEQLEDEEKVKFLDKYSGIPPFIHSMLKDYESVIKSFASVLMKYEAHIGTFEEAEHAYFALNLQPRILTKKAYEEALKETRAKLEANNFSLIQLIKAELHKNLRKHYNGEETPYSAHFEQLKKKIHAEHYSLYLGILEDDICSTLDDYQLTEDSTYYEILVHIPNIFYITDNRIKDTDSSLLETCPELLKAIADYYSQLEGLEYVRELTLSDYADPCQTVNFKTSYNLDLLNSKQRYDSPTLFYKGILLLHGAAVIEGNLLPLSQVKNDIYYYTLPESTMRNMAEGLLDNSDVQQEILTLKNFLKMSGRLLNAYAYALDLMAEVTDLKGYKKLKKNHMDADLEGLMAHAANAPAIIERMGFLEFEGDTEDLKKRVKDTFDLKFKLKDIYFTAKEKAEAKKRYNEYEDEELEDKVNEALKYLKGRANT
jgi:hypothetical protein